MLLNFKGTSRKINISLNILVILFIISVAEVFAVSIIKDIYRHNTLINIAFFVACSCALFTGIYLIGWKDKTELVLKKDSKRLRKILEWVSNSEGYYFTFFAVMIIITAAISLIVHVDILDNLIIRYMCFGIFVAWFTAIILSSLCVSTKDFVKEESQNGLENI